MGRDRSLEEFLGGESDGSTGANADADADENADADADENAEPTASGRDDIEPAAVTYRWEPGGVRCAECGTAVEQLWSGESGQVCAECKEG